MRKWGELAVLTVLWAVLGRLIALCRGLRAPQLPGPVFAILAAIRRVLWSPGGV